VIGRGEGGREGDHGCTYEAISTAAAGRCRWEGTHALVCSDAEGLCVCVVAWKWHEEGGMGIRSAGKRPGGHAAALCLVFSSSFLLLEQKATHRLFHTHLMHAVTMVSLVSAHRSWCGTHTRQQREEEPR